MNSNFKEVVKACKSDCFGVSRCPCIFNQMKSIYDLRQQEIKATMENLNQTEKDMILRGKLFSELSCHHIFVNV